MRIISFSFIFFALITQAHAKISTPLCLTVENVAKNICGTQSQCQNNGLGNWESANQEKANNFTTPAGVTIFNCACSGGNLKLDALHKVMYKVCGNECSKLNTAKTAFTAHSATYHTPQASYSVNNPGSCFLNCECKK